MSPLRKSRGKEQPKTIYKRPSPKHNDHILSLAQDFVFFQDTTFPFYTTICDSLKGISLFISKGKVRAGMTVEASIVLPLFLFFFLNLSSVMEMIRLHSNLELALWEMGNRMALYGSVLGKSDASEDSFLTELAGVAWSYTYVKEQLVDYLGEAYLNQTPLVYGVDGLQFLESDIYESKDCFEMVVTYAVQPSFDIVGFKPFRMANKYYGHLWNGYEIPITAVREDSVYVTINGKVYHTDRNCTHLSLSVQQVSWYQACISRNEQGRMYSACEKCGGGRLLGNVYITKEGNCYHYDRNCSGLKRTIMELPFSKIGDLKKCQRCSEGAE